MKKKKDKSYSHLKIYKHHQVDEGIDIFDKSHSVGITALQYAAKNTDSITILSYQICRMKLPSLDDTVRELDARQLNPNR